MLLFRTKLLGRVLLLLSFPSYYLIFSLLQFLFWTDEAGKIAPTFIAVKPSGTVATIKGSFFFISMQSLYPRTPPNSLQHSLLSCFLSPLKWLYFLRIWPRLSLYALLGNFNDSHGYKHLYALLTPKIPSLRCPSESQSHVIHWPPATFHPDSPKTLYTTTCEPNMRIPHGYTPLC